LRAFVVIILLVMLFWFGKTIVRLENYHYASQVGMCSEYNLFQLIERDRCLNSFETRTSPFWHLYYALIAP